VAPPQSSPEPSPIRAAVVVTGRPPYAMYVATEITVERGRLRGPLLLEIGETFTVRMTRAAAEVEVRARVVEVVRTNHGDSAMVVAWSDVDAAKLSPFFG
jgi:hypothetical protein